MPADLLAFGRETLKNQAFSQLLGAQLDAFEPGQAQLSLPVAPQLLQQNGFVHGGVLTSEFKINYLRPATQAERLVAVATVVGSGKTQAVCRCDIYLQTGDERKLCAAAQGTIRKVE